jgi:hypothetical protein
LRNVSDVLEQRLRGGRIDQRPQRSFVTQTKIVTRIPFAASALPSNTVSRSGPPPLNASETITKWLEDFRTGTTSGGTDLNLKQCKYFEQ